MNLNPFYVILAFVITFGAGMFCYHAIFGGRPLHAFTVMQRNWQYTILECSIVQMKSVSNSKRAYLLIRNGGDPIYCYINLYNAPYGFVQTVGVGDTIYRDVHDEVLPLGVFSSANRLYVIRKGDIVADVLSFGDALPVAAT